MSITPGSNIVASDFISTSGGAGDSGKVPKLNGSRILDNSFLSFKGQLTSGITTHDISSATSTTIAHGLGFTPLLAKITTFFAKTPTNGASGSTMAVYSASTQSSMYITRNEDSGAVSQGQTYRISQIPGSNYIEGVITVDSTNITITWTKTGTPNGLTFNIIWEAFA